MGVTEGEGSKYGGAFGVAEGGNIAGLIRKLIMACAEAGGSVIATRDYHPADHCSFGV